MENQNLKQKPKQSPAETAQFETDLVERLKKGQEWAFNTLVKTYENRLLKIAYGITMDKEESLEVVQDVFISVHKNIATFRQEASLATWLRKITINLCLNWKRKWKRRFRWHHHSIETDNDFNLLPENIKSQDPESMIREKQMETQVMTAIKTLPEKLRTVFVLNTIEGLSYAEIAETLNIKKGTVSSRLHTARTLIMDSLQS